MVKKNLIIHGALNGVFLSSRRNFKFSSNINDCIEFFYVFLSAAFSIGGGIVMLAVLSPLLPTSSLIPVHGIIQLGSNFGRAILLFKYIKWNTILPYAIGSIVGSFLGASIFTNIPEQYIKLAIGLFIIFSVFSKLPKVKNGYLWLAGFVVSFMGMLLGVSGLLMASFVNSMKLNPTDHVATLAGMDTFQHLFKSIAFGFFGFQFISYAPLLIGMIVTGFVGTIIGKKLLISKGMIYFQTILNIILVVAGISMLWEVIR